MENSEARKTRMNTCEYEKNVKSVKPDKPVKHSKNSETRETHMNTCEDENNVKNGKIAKGNYR